jgi:GntR family transcriptional regulator
MSTPEFQLDPSTSEPLYRQLMAQVRRFVAAGLLKSGDELPSVRELAQSFAINPMTISKAYSLLEAEGVLKRPRGARMVIAETSSKHLVDRHALLLPCLQVLLRQATELGMTRTEIELAVRKFLEEQR